jgi:hypothetical protein
LTQRNLANQAANPPRAAAENLKKSLNQVDDVNGDNDSSSKLVHQADKDGNVEVTKADDANKANNNNAHANEAVESEASKPYVAKDAVDTNKANEAAASSAANVANKQPHPL